MLPNYGAPPDWRPATTPSSGSRGRRRAGRRPSRPRRSRGRATDARRTRGRPRTRPRPESVRRWTTGAGAAHRYRATATARFPGPSDAVALADGRAVPELDQARAEAAVRELLLAVGEDPDRDGLRDTPARVARAYAEIFAGLYADPATVLDTTFDEDHDEMVLVQDIPMYSTAASTTWCPFHGVAHVGYIPGADGRVTGLSSSPGWSTSTPGARRCRSG